jgi:nicotinamidase-related amidase
MNAFYSTNLDNLLRGLGVEKLVITGAWTNMSIEHTARNAADAGYEAVVVSDATSTVNDEWHHAALNYALTNVAEIGTTEEALRALGVKAAARKPARRAARRRAPARSRR